MKRVLELTTDAEAEAEAFLDQDLSNPDFKAFKPMRFETAPKAAALNMRLPKALREAVKVKGLPYAGYLRKLLEADVASSR